jgi:hypothetical protein
VAAVPRRHSARPTLAAWGMTMGRFDGFVT